MKIRSRTEVKIEQYEIRTVRTNSGSALVYCSNCNEQTMTLTTEELASFLRVAVTEIRRQIDASEIHLVSSVQGIGLICGKSLEGKEMHSRSASS